MAKYLNVTSNLSAAEIGFLDLHGPLDISGPTQVRRCSNLSGDMRVNLQNGVSFMKKITCA